MVMRNDRQKLEELRVRIAHIASEFGIVDSLIDGNAWTWVHNAHAKEDGWTKLSIDIVNKIKELKRNIIVNIPLHTDLVDISESEHKCPCRNLPSLEEKISKISWDEIIKDYDKLYG